jgi:hypothetical protein
MQTLTTRRDDIERARESAGYYLIGEDKNRTDHLYRPQHNDVLLVTPTGIQNRVDLGVLCQTIADYRQWWAKRCGWAVTYPDIRGRYDLMGTTSDGDGTTYDHIYRPRDATIHIVEQGNPSQRIEITGLSEGESVHTYIEWVDKETNHTWRSCRYAKSSDPLVGSGSTPQSRQTS